MDWLTFLLMTAFNATVCLLLPRAVTLDWKRLYRHLRPFELWKSPKSCIRSSNRSPANRSEIEARPLSSLSKTSSGSEAACRKVFSEVAFEAKRG